MKLQFKVFNIIRGLENYRKYFKSKIDTCSKSTQIVVFLSLITYLNALG